eukprot:COSAG01_NODE_56537_length_317_cov_6.504587_1_plen_68_part_10
MAVARRGTAGTASQVKKQEGKTVRTVTTSIGAPPTSLVYGHTTMNAPYLVRTAKLSIVRPCQYYGGGP